MTRRNPRRYAGPSQRITIEDAMRLGPEWVVQEKIDGMYVEVRTDDDGVVASVASRSGRSVNRGVHRLLGERAFLGPATLVGELEAHTEAGNRAAASRPGGRPRLWLYDIVCGGAYRQRRDVLYRGWAGCEAGTGGDRDSQGRFRPDAPRHAVVDQVPIRQLGRVYEDTIDAGGEGVVLVNTRAPLGARGAKLKLKPTYSVDCPVISVSRKTVELLHPDGYRFKVGKGRKDPQVGELWEIENQGTYHSGVLKFPALTKRRDDIACLAPRRVRATKQAELGRVVQGPWG